MVSDPRGDTKPHHDRGVLLLALLAGLPAVLVALWFIWSREEPARLRWTLGPVIVGCWLGFGLAVRQRVVRPLRTLAGLLAGLREGDFSSRARGADPHDPLGTVIGEINALGDTLQEQRVGALEATALLRRVMSEIDVAVFAFDDRDTLRLINRAGERLLGQPAERLDGLRADQLGLAACLAGEARRFGPVGNPPQHISSTFPSASASGCYRPESRAPRRRATGVAAPGAGVES